MDEPVMIELSLSVNGVQRTEPVDTRTTLLDLLREQLGLTGPKKGCDHGQCGACTVLIDGRRANACLALAVAHDGAEIISVEGLATARSCIPCNRHSSITTRSNAATARRARSARPSGCCGELGRLAERGDAIGAARLTAAEIRERMNGNLCRCGDPNVQLDAADPRRGRPA